jgi:DtxR family Mn-dependent transcriptional regulator
VEREEEYLEAIYDIQKTGRVAKTGEIARILKVKPSSVTEMLLKLKKKGYIDYNPYRGAVLTKSGEEIAVRIKRHYRIASSFFRQIGVEEEVAQKLGCELEHYMNEEVARRLGSLLTRGCETCNRDVKRLSCVSEGIYVVVSSPGGDLKPGERVRVENGEIRKEDGSKVLEEIIDLVLVRESL